MDLRNRLLQVSELNLADKIDSMDETQLGLYIQKINYFIDSYPNQERSVKEAVAARDMGLISKSLVSVWDMLDKLHAENLSERGLALITSAKGSSAEKMEAEVTAFLTDAAALSIEMQMAQQLMEDDTIYGAPTPEVEREYKVLAVDDASFFLNTLKAFLAETQFKVTCVTSGATALRYLASHTPDLFILDIEMPEMDGYELAKEIKKRGFKAPIIFLTGNASKEYVMKAIKSGGVDFIVKPIDKNRVLEKIKHHVH